MSKGSVALWFVLIPQEWLMIALCPYGSQHADGFPPALLLCLPTLVRPSTPGSLRGPLQTSMSLLSAALVEPIGKRS